VAGRSDCSSSAAAEKLIERPGPGFPDEVRQAMGGAAVKVTAPAGVNAGTVEFLPGRRVLLPEMNTGSRWSP
jgi:acetyl/propionyl-CoA carboxylase alpha subunit